MLTKIYPDKRFMLNVPLQVVFETFLPGVNIYQFTLPIGTEIPIGLRVLYRMVLRF
jgi:hypothetical protein